MSDMLQVNLFSPERPLTQVKASEVLVPGSEGYLGILPGHTPLISQLGAGELKIVGGDSSADDNYFIAGGYIEVLDNNVKVLVDVVERIDEIDSDRADLAEKRAMKRLDDKEDLSVDITRALFALERAKARKGLSKSKK